MFGHQYSQTWIDFRGIRDAWSRQHGLDFFENSRRATYSQRAYAMANPRKLDRLRHGHVGPDRQQRAGQLRGEIEDRASESFTAIPRAARALDYVSDDGTIAPTAAGGSIAFAPGDRGARADRRCKQRYGKIIYNRYGFVDAFNRSFHYDTKLRTGRLVPGFGWADDVQLGIDQGPIVLMIENWRSGLIWKVMRKNPYIRKGLERAGFTGGWLDKSPPTSAARP